VRPDYDYKDVYIQVGEVRQYPNELYYSQDDGCWRLGKKTRSGEWGPGWGERQQPRRVDNIEYQSEETNPLALCDAMGTVWENNDNADELNVTVFIFDNEEDYNKELP